MAERKNTDPDGLSIVASPDDPVSGRGRDSRGTAPAPAARRDPRATKESKASGPGIGIIVILGLIIIGGGAFGYVLKQQLQLATTQLASATDRIRRLEEQLNVTGSTLNETSEKAAERIKSGETAMSKLGDNLNRTRAATEENRRLIGRVDAALRALSESVKALDGTTVAQGKSLAQHQTWLTKAGENLRDVASTNRELQDKINAAEQNVRAVRVGVERRVTENEQAIAAFDTFRKQVNRTLTNLSGEIATLKNPKGEK